MFRYFWFFNLFFTNLLLWQPVCVDPVFRLCGFGPVVLFPFFIDYVQAYVTLDFRLTCNYLYLTLTPTPSVPEQVARVQYNPLRQGRMFFWVKFIYCYYIQQTIQL